MRLLILISAVMAGLAASAMARPISYPGGWMVMQENDASSNNLQLQYSPSSKYSIGYDGEYWREKEWQFHGIAINNLLNRWNNKDSQANLYLLSAGGVAYSNYGKFDGKTEIAGFTGVAVDWEDRRFFTSYANRLTYAGDIGKEFREKARIGVAPYIGEYGDLHSWLMLQFDHAPSDRHNFTVTPLVRLFKGTTLAEAGVSNRGTILINIMHIF
jgi:hypothetical protein